jgi:hypothetical protein
VPRDIEKTLTYSIRFSYHECKARSAGRWEIREYLAYYYRDVYGDGGVRLEIAIK